ncbi:hypothetical protein [Gimesia maris]|uniref:hypothetical protein n=1 Tax=Gimesia maris TaxID=122 RepID=UPI003A8D6057
MVAPSKSGRLNINVRHKAQRGIAILALRILHDAWPATAADSTITRKTDEDAISDVLRWNMVAAKQRIDPVPEMKFLREPQSDRPELDTPLGLIDIMVSYTWDESTYLTMECKRISSTTNSLALKYVRNGINRFASGKYSAGHAFGIVVGYVICGSPDGCVDRVSKTLAKEPKNRTGLDAKFGWVADVETIYGQTLYRTKHLQRDHNNSIELIHTFLSLN